MNAWIIYVYKMANVWVEKYDFYMIFNVITFGKQPKSNDVIKHILEHFQTWAFS